MNGFTIDQLTVEPLMIGNRVSTPQQKVRANLLKKIYIFLPANNSLVGILITIGDVTDIFVIRKT